MDNPRIISLQVAYVLQVCIIYSFQTEKGLTERFTYKKLFLFNGPYIIIAGYNCYLYKR